MMSVGESRVRLQPLLWLMLLLPVFAHAGLMDMFDGAKVVARMGEAEFTDADLNKYLATLDAAERVQLLKKPDALRQQVKDLMLQEQLTQQARHDAWDKQGNTQSLMARAEEQVLYSAYMSYIGRSDAGFPDEQLINTNYQLNREKYRLPQRIHVAQIFLPHKSDPAIEAKQKAAVDDLAAKAKQPQADFARLARSYSQHAQSKANGGDMGWLDEDKLLPEISKGLQEARVGDVIGPITTKEGLHVIKLLGRSSGDYRPLQSVRKELVQALIQKKSTEKQQAYLQEQVSQTPIKVDSRALRNLQEILQKGETGSFSDRAVATMGVNEYRLSDAVIYLEILGPERGAAMANDRDALEQLMQQEVMRKYVLGRARVAGWQNREQVKAQMEYAGMKALYASYLRHITVPKPDYPSKAEVESLYQEKKADFAVSERLRIAQIYLPVTDITEEQAVKKQLDELAKQIRSGKGNFSLLAKRNSKHAPSAENGGEMGWFSIEQLLPEMRTALKDAKKGEVLGPVRGEQGWHLFRVLDRQPPGYLSLAEATPRLIAALRKYKHLKNQEKYVTDLMAKTPIKVIEGELSKFYIKQGTGA